MELYETRINEERTTCDVHIEKTEDLGTFKILILTCDIGKASFVKIAKARTLLEEKTQLAIPLKGAAKLSVMILQIIEEIIVETHDTKTIHIPVETCGLICEAHRISEEQEGKIYIPSLCHEEMTIKRGNIREIMTYLDIHKGKDEEATISHHGAQKVFGQLRTSLSLDVEESIGTIVREVFEETEGSLEQSSEEQNLVIFRSKAEGLVKKSIPFKSREEVCICEFIFEKEEPKFKMDIALQNVEFASSWTEFLREVKEVAEKMTINIARQEDIYNINVVLTDRLTEHAFLNQVIKKFQIIELAQKHSISFDFQEISENEVSVKLMKTPSAQEMVITFKINDRSTVTETAFEIEKKHESLVIHIAAEKPEECNHAHVAFTERKFSEESCSMATKKEVIQVAGTSAEVFRRKQKSNTQIRRP
uniref:Uncharacterized protein n=1 Tax=Romanomermis culicivorax TaxID=13658 RepID=A0A915LE71_ROMCU